MAIADGVGRARAADRVARSSAERLLRAGVLASVIVLFGVSGGMLWLVGYNYDGLTGSAVTKIHPFTYLISVLFVVRAVTFGNPVAYLAQVANRRPAALFMVVVAFTMLLRTVLREAPGMAGFIDTYVGPPLLVILLADARAETMTRLDRLLHVMMGANALLALFEFATKKLLFPYRFEGAVFATDMRSSALHGHPLANALVTAVYILALMTGGRTLPSGFRLSMIALQGAALVAFGGRTAMVIAIVFGGSYAVVAAFRSLRHGRVSLLGAATAIVLLCIVPMAVAGAALGGFFDALMQRFVSDGGSANARVEMLGIFDHLSLGDIIVGPDTDLIETLRRTSGLEWGIENPIVHMTLYQGAFLTLLVTVSLGLFLRELLRPCVPGAWMPLVGFLLLINTSESISVKTTILAKFAVIVLCLFRRPFSPSAERSPRAAWSGPALRRSPDRAPA